MACIFCKMPYVFFGNRSASKYPHRLLENKYVVLKSMLNNFHYSNVVNKLFRTFAKDMRKCR